MDQASFQKGVALLNATEYFEAHEVLENVWRAAPSHEKKFCQGMVQVAVALHHWSKGNLIGANSVATRALKNLSGYGDDFAGIYLRKLENGMLQWLHSLDDQTTCPAPTVEWCHSPDNTGDSAGITSPGTVLLKSRGR